MKATKFLMFMFSLVTLISCNSSQEKKEETATNEENKSAYATPEFQHLDSAVSRQLSEVVQHYIHLKNGLVKSDNSQAKAGADGVLKAIAAFDSSKLSAKQKTGFLSVAGKIKTGAQAISETADVEKQRESFNTLTEGIYSLIKTFNTGKKYFYEYCPMANNSNGGYWLSESDEIDNPYFGDEMLHCGEVKETIQ